MKKLYSNNYSEINLYRKNSSRSEVVTQMIFGNAFYVLNKNSNWWKIKILEDNYKGFIKKRHFVKFFRPTHKVATLSAKIFRRPNFRKQIGSLTFGSKIKLEGKKSKFFKFNKNMWIERKNVRPIKFKDKNCFSRIKIFKNIKYKWGGKSYKGIDCSGLVQVILNFNNIYCPRDAKDQARYFKRKVRLKNLKKNDLIFWKGHVAVALSKDKLIHAYGPLKKTVIMSASKTISRIEDTAKLKVLSVKRVN